ncbi:helix-turn-helix domain-containing protein [Tumebacillus flagellatus]|uniref:HTH cro/C1-type domain-containing protein n=1 Tax=Tumebacillus flagellatus TaxID=1157490 RepID=A0A074LJV3_9BACL|nr:helix-turn-helix transcriptional regulator [Tumebacillus flagellatus]KEO80890.1 hypothetical protein EL26_23825 [Tumebacillus flagellatus]
MEAPIYTLVDNIPLGQRIEELKKEKGGWYSTTAMAGRLGVSPETLRSMLKGKREIYMYELEKIAGDLKMPVKRILLEDVYKQRKTLDSLLTPKEISKDNLQQAYVNRK